MVLVAMFVIQATVKIYVYNVCGAVSMLEKFLDPYWDWIHIQFTSQV